ncbi:ParB/RepB/Spo0J family partition protein [Yoonia sp. R2331]|uniref:ParB/RepB/Spo0J family partition protein n=1 Tax=Yoonia sp. R2331 TaxID=3237238 RepID=UPI0034E3C3AB
MAKSSKPRGLGRGLSALMADVQTDAPAADAPKRPDLTLPIDSIRPNPDQPRRTFDNDALSELADSIKEKGVIQPLIVRRDPNDGQSYQIVAGERRWRASQMAQLHELPVLIRDFDDTEVLEIAIIENIQRADLNPVDEATGYRQLMDRFGHTQDQMAQALGKSRSHIANLLRLLNLPDPVLGWLATGKLTAGHARALVGHDDATKLAQHIIQKRLSVREAEKIAKTGLPQKGSKRSPAGGTAKDADTVQIEQELTAHLKMKVAIDHKPGQEGGKLTINYQSFEQLDDLLRTLGGG